jgi:hypothetical protein
VVRKMAENQEKSAKRFTFEADTEDSYYLAVKRIEFNLANHFDIIESNIVRLIKLLPNAEIQLTLDCEKSRTRLTGQIGMYK